MISAVSNVNFRGEVGNTDLKNLINSPGKYSNPTASPAKMDQVELSNATSNKEKSNTGLVLAGIGAALLATWVALGVAVSKNKLAKIETPDGWGEKIQNFGHTIGESAVKAYDATLGKLFSKKADDVAEATTKGAEAGAAGEKAAGEATAE